LWQRHAESKESCGDSMLQTDFPLIVTGAGGRVGRLLRNVAPKGRVIWATHTPSDNGDLSWDTLISGVPTGAVIVHLAGAVKGELGLNATLAQQVCNAPGSRHVFVASTAAVYRPSERDVQEDTPTDPQNAYGAAKLAMEREVRGQGVTLLRIGNVAGADALLGGLVAGQTAILDPVVGQSGGPLRSYIGPMTFWRILQRLAEMAVAGVNLPEVLNVASPGAMAMADLLDAAGAPWTYGAQRADTVPRVVLDVSRLSSLMPIAAAKASDVVGEWRAAQ
jgi:nucleoside-diphosphate-sugar epimerase